MVTTVTLPDELHASLKKIAGSEHRSVNATIVVAIAEYVQNRDKRIKVRELAADIAERDRELLERLAQ